MLSTIWWSHNIFCKYKFKLINGIWNSTNYYYYNISNIYLTTCLIVLYINIVFLSLASPSREQLLFIILVEEFKNCFALIFYIKSNFILECVNTIILNAIDIITFQWCCTYKLKRFKKLKIILCFLDLIYFYLFYMNKNFLRRSQIKDFKNCKTLIHKIFIKNIQ